MNKIQSAWSYPIDFCNCTILAKDLLKLSGFKKMKNLKWNAKPWNDSSVKIISVLNKKQKFIFRSYIITDIICEWIKGW